MRSEEQLHRWLARHLGDPGGEDTAIVGDDAAIVGDDAAIVELPAEIAITTDAQHAGVHFPPDLDLALVARRLAAVNLSDLAAMGAIPDCAVVSLAAPPASDHRRFLRALSSALEAAGARLVGGDTSRLGQLSAVLALIGRRCPGGSWLRRSAARPGESLWCGGILGLSALGQLLVARGAGRGGRGYRLPEDLPPRLHRVARRALRRHLQPRPQLELGWWLARRRPAGAAIDVSDGLGIDLSRLCEASGCGALVRAESLPADAEAAALGAWLGVDADDLALAGGEDYVLLFTLPPSKKPPPELGCRRIGETIAGEAVELETPAGREDLRGRGYDHLLAGDSEPG